MNLPFMAFYPNDFLDDEIVLSMTTTEVGAYILLLCAAWKSKIPCSLPNVDSTLANASRMTIEDWLKVKKTVLAPFEKRGGRIYSKRMLKEREIALEKMADKSQKAKEAIAKRWAGKKGKTDKTDTSVLPTNNAGTTTVLPANYPSNTPVIPQKYKIGDCRSNPLSSPTPSPEPRREREPFVPIQEPVADPLEAARRIAAMQPPEGTGDPAWDRQAALKRFERKWRECGFPLVGPILGAHAGAFFRCMEEPWWAENHLAALEKAKLCEGLTKGQGKYGAMTLGLFLSSPTFAQEILSGRFVAAGGKKSPEHLASEAARLEALWNAAPAPSLPPPSPNGVPDVR